MRVKGLGFTVVEVGLSIKQATYPQLDIGDTVEILISGSNFASTMETNTTKNCPAGTTCPSSVGSLIDLDNRNKSFVNSLVGKTVQMDMKWGIGMQQHIGVPIKLVSN